MGSCRVKGTNEHISTFGPAGGGYNYTSVSAWEQDTDNDLVTSQVSEVLECYKCHTSLSTGVTLAGATTNATYFRIVRPAGTIGTDNWQGVSTVPAVDGTCVSFQLTVNGSVFTLSEQYSSIQDLVFKNAAMTGSEAVVLGYSSYSKVVGCCIIESTTSAATCVGFLFSNGVSNVAVNCLVVNCPKLYGFSSNTGVSGVNYFYNCTSVANYRGFYRSYTATATAVNCCAEDNVNAQWSGTFTKTTCTDNGGVTFVDQDNDDCRLADTDTVARNAGTSLAADSTFAFNDDFFGATISDTWDIGFHNLLVSKSINVYSEVEVVDVSSACIVNCITKYDVVSSSEVLTVLDILNIISTEVIQALEDINHAIEINLYTYDSATGEGVVSVTRMLTTDATVFSQIRVSDTVTMLVSGYLIAGRVSFYCESMDLELDSEAV